jgi:hypothetical protein
MDGEKVMDSIRVAVNALAFGIGYGAMAIGGITLAFLFTWLCVEVIANRLGMARRLIRYSRYIKQAEQARVDAGGKP